MAKPTPVQKLANLSVQGNAPIPRILLPSVPKKLANIDPELVVWQASVQKSLDDHVQKLNVLNGNVVQKVIGT